MKKMLIVTLAIVVGLSVIGCANYETLKQKEIRLNDLWAQRSDLIIKRFKDDYKDCDRFVPTQKMECKKRAEEKVERDMKRLDDEIKEFNQSMRHIELINAIRSR